MVRYIQKLIVCNVDFTISFDFNFVSFIFILNLRKKIDFIIVYT